MVLLYLPGNSKYVRNQSPITVRRETPVSEMPAVYARLLPLEITKRPTEQLDGVPPPDSEVLDTMIRKSHNTHNYTYMTDFQRMNLEFNYSRDIGG